MTRGILIYRDENGEWCATCPSLPGCHSQGESREDAIINIKDAIEGYIEILEDVNHDAGLTVDEFIDLL